MAIKVIDKYLSDFVGPQEYQGIAPLVEAAHQKIAQKNGLGNDFLGWVDLPSNYDKAEFSRIKAAAARVQANSQVFIVIGIGGSYLGARAAIEFVKSNQYNDLATDTPKVYFTGNSISSSSLAELVQICEGKDVSINMISKSGTTTEPAIAFRVFRDLLERKYGKEEAKKRIFCTTDRAKGTLKKLADQEGFETFVVPDDVGGRFSVLTAVGLLPIAVAGIDIDALMAGAASAAEAYRVCDLETNDCYRYAAIRNILYNKGKAVEVMASYEPCYAMMNEWWKQLYGESEGKDQKGLFPASVIFSTDLHSMGQYMQDGRRHLFETVIRFATPKHEILLTEAEADIDGLNYLAGQSMDFVNQKACQATILAHTDGQVPNIIIDIPDFSANTLGQLFYFFEKACALSGYLLGVNPFDQPGVESYKKNMFALLGKPGFEAQQEALEKRLS